MNSGSILFASALAVILLVDQGISYNHHQSTGSKRSNYHALRVKRDVAAHQDVPIAALSGISNLVSFHQALLVGPMVVPILGQLVVLSTLKNDFDLQYPYPSRPFHYLRFQQFRPSVTQVANEVKSSFGRVNDEMKQIQGISSKIPGTVEQILRILTGENGNALSTVLRCPLDSVENALKGCIQHAEAIVTNFDALMNLTSEFSELLAIMQYQFSRELMSQVMSDYRKAQLVEDRATAREALTALSKLKGQLSILAYYYRAFLAYINNDLKLGITPFISVVKPLAVDATATTVVPFDLVEVGANNAVVSSALLVAHADVYLNISVKYILDPLKENIPMLQQTSTADIAVQKLRQLVRQSQVAQAQIKAILIDKERKLQEAVAHYSAVVSSILPSPEPKSVEVTATGKPLCLIGC